MEEIVTGTALALDFPFFNMLCQISLCVLVALHGIVSKILNAQVI
jgi:hypothetical protein